MNIPSNAQSLALGPELQSCTQDLLEHLCDPVSLEQPFEQHHTAIAHVESTSASLSELGYLLQACGETAGNAGYPSAAIEEWFEEIVRFGPCDATGRLIDSDEIFSSVGSPDKAPTPGNPGTCQ